MFNLDVLLLYYLLNLTFWPFKKPGLQWCLHYPGWCWNELIETEVSVSVFISKITVSYRHFNWISNNVFLRRTEERSLLGSNFVLLIKQFE